MIENPILKGFNPDPSIVRKGTDYYIACSSFEWFPGIPVYHSKDLKNWELYTHIITDDEKVNLKNLQSSKGLWAPSLTYCEDEDLFYVVYGVMNSTNGRYFDVDNYLITSKNITGPWSEPVYLHSAGFDASLFHDTDGKKYVLSLLWETRDGYEKPGPICIAEYDKDEKKLKEFPKIIYRGGTDRGCIEGPNLYKHDDYYYLLCAEGGTGYYHCVTVARSVSPYGEYSPDPENPILSAVPENNFERNDTDHLKPRYYNPDSPLQKAGHGSIVTTPSNETYMTYLCSRPFFPELRCTLGRETAIAKMTWTDDGWLRTYNGDKMPKLSVKKSKLPEYKFKKKPEKDTFYFGELDIDYYTPRISNKSFASTSVRNGFLTLRGQESLSSTNKVSLVAKKLTSLNAVITTKMEFSPESFCHSAGLVIYRDNMNYVFLRETYSEPLKVPLLVVTRVNNGVKTDFVDARVIVSAPSVYLRITVDAKSSFFEWSTDGISYKRIGNVFNTSELSDEYSSYGEFTGTFVGMAAIDSMFHEKTADFEFFEYKNL